MNTIRVYGTLAKYLGRNVFEAEIRTAAEALRFLGANFPGLRQHVLSQRYVIAVGRHLLTATELLHPIGSQELRIIPVFTGAISLDQILNPSGGTSNPNNVPTPSSSTSGGGGGGFNLGSTLLGFAASIFGGSALSALVVGAVGIGLSYVASSLSSGNPSNLQASSSGSPRPAGPRESFSFSGIQNTTRQGVPIPVVYGETIVGSVVISAGIDTEQVKV